MKLDSAIKIKQQREAAKANEPPRPKAAKRKPPPDEQLAKNNFKSAGMAYRKTPIIDTMLAKKQIEASHYIALAYYRDQATAADKSPIKSNIDFTVRTGGQRPIGHQTPQQSETCRIEAKLGKFQPIARAIAVDDISLSQWCLDQYGGRDVLRGKKVVIEPTKKNMEAALVELKAASGKIVV